MTPARSSLFLAPRAAIPFPVRPGQAPVAQPTDSTKAPLRPFARVGCLLWSHVWHLVASSHAAGPVRTEIAVLSRSAAWKRARPGQTWVCDRCSSSLTRPDATAQLGAEFPRRSESWRWSVLTHVAAVLTVAVVVVVLPVFVPIAVVKAWRGGSR